MISRNLYFAWCCAVLLALAGCTSKRQETSGPQRSSSEIDSIYSGAAENYQMLCAGCHGRKVAAFVDREWEKGHSDELLINRIRVGDIEDGMPPFEMALTGEEIAEMAAYLNSHINSITVYEFEERPDIGQVFESDALRYKLEVVAEGLEIPWGMTFLPDNQMLVTDRNGKMYRVGPDKTKSEIGGVPDVLYKGQGGLMDVELHPGFTENSLVYISYSIFRKEEGKTLSSTAIARARLEGDRLEGLEIIFEAHPYSGTRHHYGSRIEFDREGYLYFSVGDRGNRDENPQSLDNHCGKIHRLNDDGTIPEDNPFVGDEGAMHSIYSYGHRNPQGVIMHPETGEIWTHEHGPRGGDEINLIRPGLNYGWPVISYGINYDGTIFTSLTENEGMEQPHHYWVPSIGACGMDFITGDRYPQWKGNLLVGSLKYEYLHMCRIENGMIVGEELLLKNIGRLRNVKVGLDGYIYVGVEDPGVIYRIVPVVEE